MASTIIMNTPTTSSRESAKRKKKHKTTNSQATDSPQWKSETQQKIYSTKLIQALRQVRLGKSKSVREAADQALATTSKGKTRWSRAILMNRLKIKFMKVRRQRVQSPSVSRNKKPKVSILRLKAKNLPAVQRKVKILGKLVPGCRKEALPVILEEASDYIAALEMQVRAMSALAELLSVTSGQTQVDSTS